MLVPDPPPSRAMLDDMRITAVLAIAVALLVAPPVSAQEAGPSIERIAGAGRAATAARLSAATFEPGVAVAYLSNGRALIDGLAAGPAAGTAGGPVLYAERDRLPDATEQELRRLRPERVVLVGSEQVLSADLEEAVAGVTGGALTRAGGPNRFATAAEVARGAFGDAPVVYLANGSALADGLVGSTAAGRSGGPLLLTARSSLPQPTREALAALQPQEVVVVGDERVVSGGVAQAASDAAGAALRRLAGPDRFATAASVATGTSSTGAGTAYLANGLGFADGVAAVASAVHRDAPLLLTRPVCLPAPVSRALDELAPQRVVVLGGETVTSEFVGRLVRCGRETRVIAEGLAAPWDVAFTPDGRAYIAERDTGRLLVRETDGAVREVQRFPVDPTGEGGLLGLAVSPDFERDGLLYAYYSTARDNRIVRFVPGTPAAPIRTGLPHGTIHNGGRLGFGPDGKLYASVGDIGQARRAQDRTDPAGSLLRLNPDGSVPDDNPFPGSPVYAYGMRNPQGFDWDDDKRLWEAEFGPDRDDEVNRVVPAGNYGWPLVTGRSGRSGLHDPVVVRQPPSASWSGLEVLTDGAIPEWEGDLFVAALRGQRLYRMDLDGGRVVGVEELLRGTYGRLRHVEQAPDGSLWILTSNRDRYGSPRAGDDRIIRIGPPTG